MKGSFLAAGIFFALLFAGCTGLVGNGTVTSQDCGSSFVCFLAAMQNNCTTAKVSVVENGVTALLQIKGTSQNGGCDVIIKMTDIQRTPDMTDAIWGMIESSKGGLPLLDMVCPITAQKAETLYNDKQVLAAKEVFETCRGSLKDVAMLLVGQGANETSVLSANVSIFPPEIKGGAKAAIVAKGSGGKEPYRYDFIFGDGASSMNTPDAAQTHQYSNDGNSPKEYVLNVTVRDADGAQAKAQAKVKVNGTGAPAPQQNVSLASCTETDGTGQNVRVRGKVRQVKANGDVWNYADYCTGATGIFEYYCGNNAGYGSNPTCDSLIPGSHCSNGACVKNEVSCQDGDGFTNYWMAGTVTVSDLNGTAANYDDYCEGSVLKEYYCQGASIAMDSTDCQNYNKTCANGRCA
ncbi:MAG: PKD domain-containing protein [Candidatus Micrarchaeia archaeon]